MSTVTEDEIPSPTKKQAAFKRKCIKAAESAGVDLEFFADVPGRDGLCEDDGSLHITREAVHACFNVGDGGDLPNAVQNKNTRNVMTVMGMAKLIDDRVLVEEVDEDDDDEYCPHCGRG